MKTAPRRRPRKLSVDPWVQVEVVPPWEIITSTQTPYCADSSAQVSTGPCAAVATQVNGNVYREKGSPCPEARCSSPAVPSRNHPSGNHVTFLPEALKTRWDAFVLEPQKP
jgi:hypothetical protein